MGSELIARIKLNRKHTCEDHERIYLQWLRFNAISFDDGELVAVNREVPKGFARHRDDAEPISFPLLDINDRQRRSEIGRIAS